MTDASTWHDVGTSDDFSEDAGWPLVVGGHSLALFRQGEEVFALHDLCTHGAARLSEGYVENGCVECPLHQGLFELHSGKALCAPLTQDVRTFPVRVVAGRVQVQA